MMRDEGDGAERGGREEFEMEAPIFHVLIKDEEEEAQRLPSSGHNSPSPPPSPLRSPTRLRSGGRPKAVGRVPPGQPPRTLAQRLAGVILSVLLRRQGIFLFAPLLYISGMLFYMGTVSFDVVPVIKHRPVLGSVYRSPQLYAKLRPEMDADNSSADAVSDSSSHSS
ncbi:Protein ESMERALDA 1, partial [Sarracenia purpurea var. burkii]